MKAKGREINRFYDEWPMGEDWCDDSALDLGDGLLIQHDLDKSYDVEELLPPIRWQYASKAPTHIQINDVKVRVDEVGYLDGLGAFRVWRKGQTHDHFVVAVPKGAVAEFKALLADKGWKATSA
jgi:hypothetical protein